MLAQPVKSLRTSTGRWIAWTTETDELWIERSDDTLLGEYLFNHTRKQSITGILQVTHYVRFTNFNQPESCARKDATHVWVQQPNGVGLYVEIDDRKSAVETNQEIPVKTVNRV